MQKMHINAVSIFSAFKTWFWTRSQQHMLLYSIGIKNDYILFIKLSKIRIFVSDYESNRATHDETAFS